MIIPVINKTDISNLSQVGQDYSKAELLCRLAVYSYFEGEKLETVMSKSAWSGYKAWDIGENQGFVSWSDNCAVISIRGTDSVSDWNQNSKVLWPNRHRLGGRVHRGFEEVSNQAKDRILEILASLSSGIRHLWITGHSLGGAIATELSAHLMINTIEHFPRWEISTFGAPRLGDEQFREHYESHVGDNYPCKSHWNFVNEGDPVPHLPPKLFDFRHCGELYWFNKNGKLVRVSRNQVSLQGAIENEDSAIINQWNQLEQITKDTIQNEEEYTRFLSGLAEKIGNPIEWVSVNSTTGTLDLSHPEGQLQGAIGDWIAEDHKSDLYLSRLRSLI